MTLGAGRGDRLRLDQAGAVFSSDRVYRYQLWRRWAAGPMLMVIGLNPSTADETRNDPTVTRCIGFARLWGFSGLLMTNLFAYRATDPRDLIRFYSADPTLDVIAIKAQTVARRENRRVLVERAVVTTGEGGVVLAAWGGHGRLNRESESMRIAFSDPALGVSIACLGLTKSGEPLHPLYLRADTVPQPFIGRDLDLARLVRDRQFLAL